MKEATAIALVMLTTTFIILLIINLLEKHMNQFAKG